MKKNKSYGNELGVKEHLLSGKPIKGLEALLFFGVRTLTDAICRIRLEQFFILRYKAYVRRGILMSSTIS